VEEKEKERERPDTSILETRRMLFLDFSLGSRKKVIESTEIFCNPRMLMFAPII
jgi:hypothetical protein